MHAAEATRMRRVPAVALALSLLGHGVLALVALRLGIPGTPSVLVVDLTGEPAGAVLAVASGQTGRASAAADVLRSPGAAPGGTGRAGDPRTFQPRPSAVGESAVPSPATGDVPGEASAQGAPVKVRLPPRALAPREVGTELAGTPGSEPEARLPPALVLPATRDEGPEPPGGSPIPAGVSAVAAGGERQAPGIEFGPARVPAAVDTALGQSEGVRPPLSSPAARLALTPSSPEAPAEAPRSGSPIAHDPGPTPRSGEGGRARRLDALGLSPAPGTAGDVPVGGSLGRVPGDAVVAGGGLSGPSEAGRPWSRTTDQAAGGSPAAGQRATAVGASPGPPRLGATPSESEGSRARTAVGSVDPAGAYAGYLAELRRSLLQALTYPPSARQRGLTGKVVVELTITPSGTVDRAVIVESSAHAVLDEAALEGVRRLRPHPFPRELEPRTLRVRLPVVFRLE